MKDINKGWVYVIDPLTRTLQHTEIDLDYESICKIVDAETIEVVELGHNLIMVCDENARLLDRKNRSHFRWVFRRNEDGTMSPNRYLEEDQRPVEDIVFCNKCVFASYYMDDSDDAVWSSAGLHLWQIGQCLDWLSANYHDEPRVEFHVIEEDEILH
tara:strand:- start:1995 stop:2465 length:471 start_codon:yes stop_codon:yes gene_type:complete